MPLSSLVSAVGSVRSRVDLTDGDAEGAPDDPPVGVDDGTDEDGWLG